MKRKSQAALEFLMTYGWAFLVILVMIGALAYFGVLNPKKLLPEKCTVPAGFSCDEYQISESGVTIVLKNNQGGAIQATSAAVNSEYIAKNGNVTSGLIGVGQKFTVSSSGWNQTPKVGDKIGVDFEVTWMSAGKTLPQKLTGDIFAVVQ